jgi:hypothetical protein
MVSCGADKSIIFRDVNTEDSAGITLSRVNHIVGKTTLYDMELDRYNYPPNNYKDNNPKCRLYLCLIEFRDWRYSQSC